jgi:hypothetical protein
LYSKCNYAQNCGLKLFSEKVFLNFFSDSIHPSIRDFYYNLSLIKIANSSDTIKGWSAKDSFYLRLPIYQRAVHALYFKAHPKIDGNYTTCKFEVKSGEFYKGYKTINEVSVWFYFDKETEANIFFKKIIKEASNPNTLMENIKNNNIHTVRLSENCDQEMVNTEIEIQYTKVFENELKNVIIIKCRD